MKVEFMVEGIPKGKARPKFRRVGAYTRTYTPKDTAMYESLVRACYIRDVGRALLEGAIKASIKAFFPIPNSTSKKRHKLMDAGEIPYINRPDADNIAKIILDALNGIAYQDDKQVIILAVYKAYSENPHVEVALEEIEDE